VSETRRRIADHVADEPGVHFNGLVRALDLATGQVQYHLRRLREDGAVVAETCCGRTHYYPEGYDAWERHALALLHRETTADVVAVLLADGPLSPAAVADELDLAASTVAYHVDRLVDHGLVARQRRDDGTVRLRLRRETATAALLATAHQPLAGRLADRFVRLVDRLLEDV
jgi:predicted transcriptional regulator